MATIVAITDNKTTIIFLLFFISPFPCLLLHICNYYYFKYNYTKELLTIKELYLYPPYTTTAIIPKTLSNE